MPIKGLSEKPRLPRLGKLHLGYKDETKKGAPTATDYFVCPLEVQEVFGEKPKELRVRIPVLDEEKVASQYYKCYSRTRGLVCKGDGETANCLIDVKTGAMANRDSQEVEMREVACEGRECPHYNKQCREIMCFQFMLPEVPGLGVWQIDTSSINSIRNINSTLAILGEFCRASGISIFSIPLLLILEPIPVQDPSGKKKTVNVLNLRSNQTLLELAGTTKQLPASEHEVPPPNEEEPALLVSQEPTEEPETTKQASASSTAPPEEPGPTIKTIQALLNWVATHGKTYTKSWVLKNFSFNEKKMQDKPHDCYLEIKEMMGW